MISEDLRGVLNIEKEERVGDECVIREGSLSQEEFHKVTQIGGLFHSILGSWRATRRLENDNT